MKTFYDMCHYTEVNQDSLAHYNKHLVKHNQDDKIQQNTCSQQVRVGVATGVSHPSS